MRQLRNPRISQSPPPPLALPTMTQLRNPRISKNGCLRRDRKLLKAEEVWRACYQEYRQWSYGYHLSFWTHLLHKGQCAQRVQQTNYESLAVISVRWWTYKLLPFYERRHATGGSWPPIGRRWFCFIGFFAKLPCAISCVRRAPLRLITAKSWLRSSWDYMIEWSVSIWLR